MAIKNNLPRMQVPFMSSGDPAVDAAVAPKGVYASVAQIRNLTPAQRRKRDRDSLRNRVMVDMPPDLEEVINALADQHFTSKSMIANLLMILGMYYIEQSNFNFDEIKHPSRSMRFEFMLDLPDFPNEFYCLEKQYQKSQENQKTTLQRQR